MTINEKVKILREETKVGIIEIRDALVQSEGDMDVARDIIRKNGHKFAEKKMSSTDGKWVATIGYGYRDNGCRFSIWETLGTADTEEATNNIFSNKVNEVYDKLGDKVIYCV